MMKNQISLVVLGLISLTAACQTVVPISKRTPNRADPRGVRPTIIQQRGLPKGQSRQKQVFLERKNLEITRRDRPLDPGTLIDLDNPNNNLFLQYERRRLNDFMELLISSRNTNQLNSEDANEPENPTVQEGTQELRDELLAGLPELSPADSEKPLIKSIQTRITHRFQNGDLAITFKRESTNQNEHKEISFTARVPFHRLSDKEKISTNDLVSVKWRQQVGSEVTESTSDQWEDEYSLRLSGFSEATSNAALRIKEKKKKLEGARKQLERRIYNLNMRQQKVARERKAVTERTRKLDELRAQQLQDLDDKNNEINELRDKIQEQDTLIKELQQQPLETPAEESSGDDN